MERANRTRLVLPVLVVLLALGCAGDVPETGRASESEPAGSGMGETGQSNSTDRSGTLTVEGDGLVAAGEYRLQASCSYSRSNGAFSLGMRPSGGSAPERGPARLEIRAGWAPGASIPLDDGSYEAEFEYSEVAGDGTVPSFLGDADLTLRIADDRRRGFPIVEIEARGQGDGVRFDVTARCQTMVQG